MTLTPGTPEWYEQRLELALLLCEAAELEHGLLCQYLFAAFSFKRETAEGVSWSQLESMRQWEASLLLVARQEMEHLGLVCNLLTAIGEAPYLQRPNFPLPARKYPVHVPSLLQPFGLQALKRFVLFEMPATISDDEHALMERLSPGFQLAQHMSIGQLYANIGSLFDELDGPELFIGPPSAQLANPEILPIPIRGVQIPGGPVYDVLLSAVTNNASAQQVIQQIVTEGEGAPDSTQTSHFVRFCEMYLELEAAQLVDPQFDPARPVVANADRVRIENPATADLVELFDLSYETLMLLLFRFFAQSDEDTHEIAALQHATFFPMMTAVIRPLGELVTQLPISASDPETAGPRFRFERPLALLPHKKAAWSVIEARLSYLAGLAQQYSVSPSYSAPIRQRLGLMTQNLTRMASDFGAATGAVA